MNTKLISEQVVQWRKKFEAIYSKDETPSIDPETGRYTSVWMQTAWLMYFATRRECEQEQATEIAELKAKLAEVMPLTDEQLRELHHIEEFGLSCSYEEFEQIARAIEQLLKD
jgi:molecular chaperone GrpE (heat shock protein)